MGRAEFRDLARQWSHEVMLGAGGCDAPRGQTQAGLRYSNHGRFDPERKFRLIQYAPPNYREGGRVNFGI